MASILRWSAVAAALIAVAVGVSESVQSLRRPLREPVIAATLGALRRVPLPAGADALLLLPADLSPDQASRVLFEAAWQRPDVRWCLPAAWPGGRAPDAIVTLGSPFVPPGWRELWRDDSIAAWGPAPP